MGINSVYSPRSHIGNWEKYTQDVCGCDPRRPTRKQASKHSVVVHHINGVDYVALSRAFHGILPTSSPPVLITPQTNNVRASSFVFVCFGYLCGRGRLRSRLCLKSNGIIVCLVLGNNMILLSPRPIDSSLITTQQHSLGCAWEMAGPFPSPITIGMKAPFERCQTVYFSSINHESLDNNR